MIYTVGEAAKRLGVAPSTLRYYDKMGLLPFAERSENGIRIFKESDFEWLKVIGCLKSTGMCLKDIKSFVEMAMQGDSTVEPRLELIKTQKSAVERKIAELRETLETLEYKEWYYETAKEHKSTDIPRNMPLSEIPENLQAAYKRLKGK